MVRFETFPLRAIRLWFSNFAFTTLLGAIHMKRVLTLGGASVALLLFAFGCKNTDAAKTAEQIQALEKRVEALEKRPSFPQRQMPPAQESAYQLPVGNSYVLGEKSAPVTVTVFSDYQCPFCAKVDPMLTSIISDPELKGKVNVVFKHFPLSFHKDAKPAAKAALAAGEQGADKFYAMSAKIFENQGQGQFTPENFAKWAKDIKLNVDKFKTDLKNNDAKYDALIAADTELGIKVANVRGTPSIYVGGWELRERSVDGVKNIIREKKLISAN